MEAMAVWNRDKDCANGVLERESGEQTPGKLESMGFTMGPYISVLVTESRSTSCIR